MKKAIFFFVCTAIFGLYAEMFFTPTMIEKHIKAYSEDECALIQKDLSVVRSVCLSDAKKSRAPFYLATAGAPGARKTTTLERFVSTHPEYQAGVYLDPDPRTLRYMAHTYYAKSLNSLAIANSANYEQVLKGAYEKWQGASNYIALTLLEESFASHYNIIHGTTSTGQHIPDFLARLKNQNYEVVLLLCSCPDTMRKKAIEYRNQVVGFYQSSPEDAIAKGKLFPQRMGAYFAYADSLYLYWSDDLNSPERLAATWRKGELQILDKEALELFIEKYEADRMALLAEGTLIPHFEDYLK